MPSRLAPADGQRTKGSMIRRSILAVVAISLMASAAGIAGAQSFRIRHDPNDSRLRTDIRRVVSDLSTTTVFLRIDTWQQFHRWDDGAYFIIRLDAAGDRGFDRVIEIYPGSRAFVCLLEEAAPDGDPGNIVGDRRATRPTERSVACAFPRSWFPRIQRAVRFYVLAVGSVRDRAPNRGLYRWL
jgi:hypothetical protein